jgi:glycosyltransferase involved in cell wall biosynthesis
MPPDTRLALAHDHLFQLGGAEQVLRELIRLYPSAPLYTLVCGRKAKYFLAPKELHTSYLQNIPGGIRFFKWFLPAMPDAWKHFDFSSYNVVITSSSGFVKNINVPKETIHISYCHSPARYLWGDSEAYLDSVHIPWPIKQYLASIIHEFRATDYAAAQRVNHFIANSHHIASCIRTFYGRESEVIYPPIDTKQFHVDAHRGDYYLIVSRLRPYKRVDLAIEAFNNLRLPLVIIGKGEEYRRLKAMSKNTIHFLGDVSDAQRNIFLARCKAFIYPQEEDFGITAIEAMASGRPIIAYRAGGALETVVPGVSGVFFDEQSWESLAYTVLRHEYEDLDPTIIRMQSLRFDTMVFRERIQHFLKSIVPKSS